MAKAPRVPIRDRSTYLMIPLAVGALAPLLIVIASLVAAGRTPVETLEALGDLIVARRLNLIVLTLIGMPPFLILGGLAWWRHGKKGAQATFWPWLGGLLGILNLVLPIHAGFWPRYFRGGSMGFPHGLELILGPVVSLVPMGFGWLLGWIVWRLAFQGRERSTR